MSRNDLKAASRSPTRTCFIGNLHRDVTEKVLRDVFSKIGPIKFFRIVTDRETGAPKGFGFCEYNDVATASRAQRELNHVEMGGRNIHVDFAEDKERPGPGGPSGAGGGGRGAPQGPRGQEPRPGPGHAPGQGPVVGSLAAGQAEHAMGILVDGPVTAATAPVDTAITAVLAGMSRRQLYEILSQMKSLLQQNFPQARQIMVNNPQLTKALFQAEITLGMVPLPEGLAVQQPAPQGGPGGFAGRPQPQGFNPVPVPQGGYGGGGDPGFAPQQQQQPPYGYDDMGGGGGGFGPGPQQPPGFMEIPPPYSGGGPGFEQHGVPMDVVQPDAPMPQGVPYGQDAGGGGMGGPPSVDPRQALPGPYREPAPYSPAQIAAPQGAPVKSEPVHPNQLEDEQKALLDQVMGLTAEQIELLPAEQKAQVIALQEHSRALKSRQG